MFNKLRAYITAVKLEREINKMEREANQLIEDEIVARSIQEIDARIAKNIKEYQERQHSKKENIFDIDEDVFTDKQNSLTENQQLIQDWNNSRFH